MLLGVDCPCSSQARFDACAQLSQIAMSLLRYMQVVPRRGGLPDPAGPLSLSLSPSAIEGANAAVTTARQEWLTKTAGKRGPYLRLDNEARAEIGKYDAILMHYQFPEDWHITQSPKHWYQGDHDYKD